MKITTKSVDQTQFISDAVVGNYQANLWRQFGAVDPDTDALWWYSANAGNGAERRAHAEHRPQQGPAGRRRPRQGPPVDLVRRPQGGLRPAPAAVRGRHPLRLAPARDLVHRGRQQRARPDQRAAARRRAVAAHRRRRRLRRRGPLDPDVGHQPVTAPERRPVDMRFVRKRVIQLVLVLLVVTFLSFFMINLLPGDPARVVCGISCDQKAYEQTRKELGLDKPIIVSVRQVAQGHGHRGHGQVGHQPAAGVRAPSRQRLPVTLELLIYSEIIALVLAIPMAILAAQRAGSVFDRVSTTVAFGMLSVPDFVVGHPADPDLRGEPGVVPGHQTGRLLHRPDREPARHVPAGADPGLRRDGGLHAAVAHRPHLHAAGGLHHDGQGQGDLVPAGADAPRLPAVELLADHGDRPRHRSAHRRRLHRRDPLRPQRHRQLHRDQHLLPRLHPGAGRRRAGRRRPTCSSTSPSTCSTPSSTRGSAMPAPSPESDPGRA